MIELTPLSVTVMIAVFIVVMAIFTICIRKELK